MYVVASVLWSESPPHLFNGELRSISPMREDRKGRASTGKSEHQALPTIFIHKQHNLINVVVVVYGLNYIVLNVTSSPLGSIFRAFRPSLSEKCTISDVNEIPITFAVWRSFRPEMDGWKDAGGGGKVYIDLRENLGTKQNK